MTTAANDNRRVRMVNVFTGAVSAPTQADMRMAVDAERMTVRN